MSDAPPTQQPPEAVDHLKEALMVIDLGGREERDNTRRPPPPTTLTPPPQKKHLQNTHKQEVSKEEGATIAYGKPAEHGKPSAPLEPVGEVGGDRLVVAPSAAGGGSAGHPSVRVDVVEAVALESGVEIRTDVHGFGASAGPVQVEEGGKVVAREAKEAKGTEPAAVGGGGAEAPTKP